MNTCEHSKVLQAARAHLLRTCPPGIAPWILVHCLLLVAFVANLTAGQGTPLSEPVVADETTEATITWLGGSGEWSAGANWSGGVAPGAGDTAVVSSGTVTISEGTIVSVAGFTFSDGVLNGAGELNITGLFTWTGGSMTGTGSLSGGTFNNTVTATVTRSGTGTLPIGNIYESP